MGVLESLHHYLAEPLIEQFLGVFDLNGRLGVLFLAISYATAYGLFRFRLSRGLTDAAHLFGRSFQAHYQAAKSREPANCPGSEQGVALGYQQSQANASVNRKKV